MDYVRGVSDWLWDWADYRRSLVEYAVAAATVGATDEHVGTDATVNSAVPAPAMAAASHVAPGAAPTTPPAKRFTGADALAWVGSLCLVIATISFGLLQWDTLESGGRLTTVGIATLLGTVLVWTTKRACLTTVAEGLSVLMVAGAVTEVGLLVLRWFPGYHGFLPWCVGLVAVAGAAAAVAHPLKVRTPKVLAGLLVTFAGWASIRQWDLSPYPGGVLQMVVGVVALCGAALLLTRWADADGEFTTISVVGAGFALFGAYSAAMEWGYMDTYSRGYRLWSVALATTVAVAAWVTATMWHRRYPDSIAARVLRAEAALTAILAPAFAVHAATGFDVLVCHGVIAVAWLGVKVWRPPAQWARIPDQIATLPSLVMAMALPAYVIANVMLQAAFNYPSHRRLSGLVTFETGAGVARWWMAAATLGSILAVWLFGKGSESDTVRRVLLGAWGQAFALGAVGATLVTFTLGRPIDEGDPGLADNWHLPHGIAVWSRVLVPLALGVAGAALMVFQARRGRRSRAIAALPLWLLGLWVFPMAGSSTATAVVAGLGLAVWALIPALHDGFSRDLARIAGPTAVAVATTSVFAVVAGSGRLSQISRADAGAAYLGALVVVQAVVWLVERDFTGRRINWFGLVLAYGVAVLVVPTFAQTTAPDMSSQAVAFLVTGALGVAAWWDRHPLAWVAAGAAGWITIVIFINRVAPNAPVEAYSGAAAALMAVGGVVAWRRGASSTAAMGPALATLAVPSVVMSLVHTGPRLYCVVALGAAACIAGVLTRTKALLVTGALSMLTIGTSQIVHVTSNYAGWQVFAAVGVVLVVAAATAERARQPLHRFRDSVAAYR